jgi:hypothetical protein
LGHVLVVSQGQHDFVAGFGGAGNIEAALQSWTGEAVVAVVC